MAVVIGSIAGSLVSKAFAQSVFVNSFITNALVRSAVGAVVGGIVSGLVSDALGGGQDQDLAGANSGLLVNKSSNNAPLPLVYGQRKIGGTRILLEVTGSKNEYLHIVIAMSEGEIDSFNNIYLNDVLSTDARFDGFLDVYTHTGSTTQAADTNLKAAVTDWGDDHQLKGTAYLYAKLKFDQDAYASGLPTITAEVKGVKVFDSRTSTTAWSDNPALCIRDYLTNGRYGRGIESSLIDNATFNSTANYCDEMITIGGVSKKRYTLNGVVNTSQNSMDVLKSLLTACRGFLVFSGGKYKLIIDKPETAVFTFSEDNIIGAWSISLGNKNSQFNRIRANFFNPDRQWQPDIAVVDSTTLRTQDNGLLLEKNIELPFTSDIDRAKMITTINLNQSRQMIGCEFTATIEGLLVEVGDVVYVKHTTPGWHTLNSNAGKLFRVMRITLQNNDEVRIMAIEYDANAYDYGTIQVSDGAPNTNLPDVSAVSAPVGLSVSEELYTTMGKGAQARALLSWGAPADAFVQSYDVEYKNGSGAWQYVINTKVLNANINDLAAGDYYFRVRSINTIGVRSVWNTTAKIIFAGLTTPPTAITNFSVRAIDGSCHLQWDRVIDLDVLHGGYIRIRHTPMTSGVTWAHGTAIGEALAGTATNVVLPLLAGTYMAKSVDSAGNFSTNDVQAITTVPNIMSFNVVAELNEQTAFNGTMVDVVKSGSVIRLDATGGGVESSGEYYFDNDLDLGAVYTSRVTANMVASGYVVSDLIDSRADNIDNWENFDGEPSDNVTAQLQIRTTQDNPASSPTWDSWQPLVVGDYHARAYEFRVIFNSTDSSRNIDISTLEVTVDMPDRNERGQSVTIPSGGLVVSYSNAFKDSPAVGITAQNMATGDYWALTAQSSNSFTIQFFNNTGTAIARNINWIATGYGRAA